MTERHTKRNEVNEYIASLTDAEREAIDSASVALDIAGLAYRARLARGFTQTEAAEASGLKQQAISRIEGGTINVTFRTLERYLRALGFSVRLSVCDENTGKIVDQITLNRPDDDMDAHLVSSAHHDHVGAYKR
ncbi:MAG TPA: helix-turn-helix transcriptional regulator [Nitrolancea sp.]|nr:helix-turn-helix transcriptional regulator [Nitrolancea sp.]